MSIADDHSARQEKENAVTEVRNIVVGDQPIDPVELFLPMQIKIRGSKAGAIVLSILSAICLIMAGLFLRSLMATSNPVDKKLFTALTLLFFVIALMVAWITYQLFKKIGHINNDANNYGIWLTKKYLICNDANEGIKFIPVSSIKKFRVYHSTRPPLEMLIAEAETPFKPVRMACNYLLPRQSPEQLEKLLTQQINVLPIPQQYLAPIAAAVAFAESYEDSKKIFLLNNRLKEMVSDQPGTTDTLRILAKYIDSKISHWNDDCKIIPEEWVFIKEVNENWEYGVNGVSYAEKWEAPFYPGNWLVGIGRVFIVETKELEIFFNDTEICNNMARILALCPLKKFIVKITLAEDHQHRIRESFAKHEKLKQTLLIFDGRAG